MKNKKDINDIKIEFSNKGYELLSTEYKNNATKLDYICLKHKELGIQQVAYNSFAKYINNCSACKHENAVGKTKKQPKGLEKRYDEIFAKYEQKIANLIDGDEYILNSISSKNKKTMLDITHKICGCNHIYAAHSFLSYHSRCQNPECRHKRKRASLLKTTDTFKKEVFNLVGDEYEVLGEYTGKDEKIALYHKKCGEIIHMSPHNFLRGERCYHCCIEPSKNEQIIIDWLEKHKIKYTFQKRFDDLKRNLKSNRGSLSYDFYLKDLNKLIECQGFFHNKNHLKTEKEYNNQLERDTFKRNYAIKNNYPLLEIYEEDVFDNVKLDKLLSDFCVA